MENRKTDATRRNKKQKAEHKLKKRITDNNMVVTVTGPEIEGKELFKESEILEIIEKIKTRPVEAYVDNVLDEPLMNDIPKPAKIISDNNTSGKRVDIFKISLNDAFVAKL